jgi:multisubunit Na+/H+ antiporter MnhC subunit
MAEDTTVAKRDKNDVPSLIAVSNVDEQTTVPIYADPVLHALIVTTV